MNEVLDLSLLQAIKALHKNKPGLLTGLSGTAKAFFIKHLLEIKPTVFYIVDTEERAYDLANTIKALQPDLRVLMFLSRDFVFRKDNLTTAEIERMQLLQSLLMHPDTPCLIVSTAAALIYRIISPAQMLASSISLKKAMQISLDKLMHLLVAGGYKRTDMVTHQGEVAVRGGILDIYPTGEQHPLRIEFFGDEIDSIRSFDIDKQRTIAAREKLLVLPADEIRPKQCSASIFDYLSDQTLLFLDEPQKFFDLFERSAKRFASYIQQERQENPEQPEITLLSKKALKEYLASFPLLYNQYFPGNLEQNSFSFYEHISQQEMETFFRHYDSLLGRLNEWLQQGYKILITYKNSDFAKSMREELNKAGLIGIELKKSSLEKGFFSNTFKIALITEYDIRGKKKVNRSQRKTDPMERVLLEDLKPGDYVVHENHGIGIFHGITQVTTEEITREYVMLQYAGTDKLYLPLDKVDLLYKYAGSGDKEPRLNKLGGTEWERTKARVAKSIQDMTEDLLKLYAARESIKGYAFSQDTPWQRQFEDEFPYEETPGQLKAINDVKKDMEKPKPMDRLVCGDVGYGKTEVALRAAFKALMDGKQVAVLVPTTILAEQHYETMKQRFGEYPANIEVLSRFRTAAQQKKILKDLETGAVDLLVATHRLLSKDVKFYDLGLLIIDEEHRFGVAQKEKIKALKTNVDVLSLSATPIPRSLHMALTGLRDLSVIDTPPPHRYPINTYVMEYNEEIIKQAIVFELKRGGQVFFVHNRVKDIYTVKEKLEEMLPGLRIVVGHGQMAESELAPAIMDFLHGQYDLFLCTTIIESGLDMPNVNTLIVDMADKMGLAQLYQLRGRVGRSDRIAYAYITYRPDKVLNEDAQKRLNAIREFNELGAGMKIALRDLEIRGAGNILGAEQHGHIHAVGFNMYCRMLEEETAKIKGLDSTTQLNPQLDFDVDYYIPDSYIPDAGARMRIYKRLLMADDFAEITDLKQELRDRFGKLPEPVENFMQLANLRVKARRKNIKSLKLKRNELYIQVNSDMKIRELNNNEMRSIKKINNNTLVLNLHGNSSLDGLEKVLDIIE